MTDSKQQVECRSPVTSTTCSNVFFAEQLFAQRNKASIDSEFEDVSEVVARFDAADAARARLKLASNEIAERICPMARIRLERGMSQAALASLAGTSQSYIARIEAGLIDPRLKTVGRIAAALGVSLSTVADALALAPETPE